MKHSIKIISFLVLIFILAQITGLSIVSNYYIKSSEGGVKYKELPLAIERPIINEQDAWIYIISAILFGTLIMLGLIKMNAKLITKVWFFLAISMGLTVAFGAFIHQIYATILAIIITLIRIIKPNILVNNFSEIFLYGGITAIFHNMLSVKVVIILLILISIYDFIAVYKSKHMIRLAKYQTKQNLFAGAMIPYNKKNKKEKQKNKKIKIDSKLMKHIMQSNLVLNKSKGKKGKQRKVAILGGGDMAFPLFFAAAIMKEYNIFLALIPVLTSTLALIYLFANSKKDKFYPAMPYLSVGCFVGYGIVLLL